MLIGKAVNNWSYYWLRFVVRVSVVLLVVTLFRFELSGDSVLKTFSLAGENTFASWWSGILLLLVSLHMFDGYILNRSTDSKAAIGWLLLSVILLGLSADELGSLHERMDKLLGFGSLLSLVPFALVLLSMLIYAVACLWSTETQRKAVLSIMLGFAVFGSVALQEALEHNIVWGPWRAVRTVIEEGSELVGIVILLRVALKNTIVPVYKGGSNYVASFEAICQLRTVVMIFGLASAPFISYFTIQLADLNRGQPTDWMAAAIFTMAGIAVIRSYLKDNVQLDWMRWAVGAFYCTASIICVAIEMEESIALPFGNFHLRTFALWIVLLLPVIFHVLRFSDVQQKGLIPVLVIVSPIITLILTEDFLFFYILQIYLATFFYYLETRRYCQ